MKHLLVTNDFPPKGGGIQAYLWELWRRLEPSSFAVLTASSHPESDAFDEMQRERGVTIERVREGVLLPSPALVRRVRRAVEKAGASLVVLDPALPLGSIGPRLGIPYAVVLHGAEVAIPARLPVSRQMLRRVVERSSLAICAGGYPAAETRRLCGHRAPPIVEVPPGVDVEKFKPLGADQLTEARAHFGVHESAPLVVSVGRLVPRKGMDVLVEAASALQASWPELSVLVAGEGRDRGRLERMVRTTGAPVRFLGGVPADRLPSLYGAADVFVTACRNRWFGLEQEGFGIVFLEAAACGVPQVAGRSGGSADAVVDGETGYVIDRPRDPAPLANALRRLLSDAQLRSRAGEASRRRVLESFEEDALARRLAVALHEVAG